MPAIINNRTSHIYQGPPPMRPLPPTRASAGAMADGPPSAGFAAENQRLKAELARVEEEYAALQKAMADLLRRDSVATIERVEAAPKLTALLEIVAAATRTSPDDLRGPRRTAQMAIPRHVFCYLARILCPSASLPMIGRFLRRDHTSVMHGIAMMERRLASHMPLAVECFTNSVLRLSEAQQAQVAKARENHAA